ncbi:MAG TPA: sensor histidine kinase [Candidatus Udaeobacter sp.]|nr:sensor histidine kinase [Candidatus Udaeobacter sp.]
MGAVLRSAALAWLLVLVVIQAVALIWRRSHPVAVLVVIFIAQAISWAFTSYREAGGPALAFAVYAVSVYDRSSVRLWVGGLSIGLIAVAVTFLVLGDFQTARSFIPTGAISLIAWVIGDYIRSRRRFFADIVERHEQDRAQAADAERLRIARELHDVVAHNVSAIAIQAGAARMSGSSSNETLESIEHSARDTLSELNKLLGVLRKNPDAPQLAPQPSLDDVETLLKPARDAGLDAKLTITGETRTLPAAVELSAYRIIQEAVTNVLKHADATRLEVNLEYQPDAVALTVADNGVGALDPPATASGHGLIGMRERVEMLGGELGVGSSSLGGYTVRATLPVRR